MDISIFGVALQSSFLIGLIHGINPCGHSWLVLTPFVNGKSASRTTLLTTSFLAGTTLACILLGLSLGAISSWIPVSWQSHVDVGVNTLIVLLGLVLILRPELLHSHDHDHDHDHGHCENGHHDHAHCEHDHQHGHDHCDHDHGHEHGEQGHHAHEPHGFRGWIARRMARISASALFTIGFVNMIVPCPTAAIMFKYAIESADPLKSSLVFTSYAVGTAIAVSVVIAGLHTAASWMRGLQKPWLEGAIMRTAGVLIVMAGTYSLASGA